MGLSLAKGQSLSLKKDDGGALTRVTLGLGWDPVKKKGLFGGFSGGGDIDLDASVIFFDANKNVLDTVYYGSLRSKDGSVQHSGDNLTGDGDGDDEQIVVDLSRVNASVQSLVFVITSYSGQKFSQLENVFCRLVDNSAGAKEFVRYNLADNSNTTGMVMATVSREGSGWAFKAVGAPCNGKTAGDVVNDAKAAA